MKLARDAGAADPNPLAHWVFCSLELQAEQLSRLPPFPTLPQESPRILTPSWRSLPPPDRCSPRSFPQDHVANIPSRKPPQLSQSLPAIWCLLVVARPASPWRALPPEYCAIGSLAALLHLQRLAPHPCWAALRLPHRTWRPACDLR